MNDAIRQAFEEITCASFSGDVTYAKNQRGEYVNAKLEDHWQTFQEGWEAAIADLKSRHRGEYSDIASTGGMDPR